MLMLVFTSEVINAQIFTPVKWEFCAKKIGDKTYEIHLLAKVDKEWHIYSKESPKFGPLPTEVVFDENASMVLVGEPIEIGEKITKYEKVFKLNVAYYNNTLKLVQTIKFKKNVPKSITGTVTYMACRREQCLAPTDVEFEVILN